MDEQCQNAVNDDCGIVIELDANAKIDMTNTSEGNTSANGQLLLNVVNNNSLIVVNKLDLCLGKITRSRVTEKVKEESTLDYILVCQRMAPFITKMNIDEEQIYTLTKFANKKGGKSMKRSDHNILTCEFNITINKMSQYKSEITR